MKRMKILYTLLLATAVCHGASRPDILIADFEGGTYGDWQKEGKAFGKGPAKGTLPKQKKVTGYAGERLASSYHQGDAATGKLTSPAFKIERPWMNLLVGGGKFSDETFVQLLVDGKSVRKAAGTSSEELRPVSWDLREFSGKTAVVEIVDRRKKGWGHISVDQIVLSEKPVVAPLEKTLAVDQTHLHIPVDNASGKQARVKLGIFDGQKLVQDFDVALPRDGKADWIATYPLDHFKLQGKAITIRTVSNVQNPQELQAAFGQIRIGEDLPAEKAADLAQPYCNQFHAAARKGWLNDPNGMVYHDGLYHLYFQHNPFGIQWGNMHWAHVVSDDMVHWKHEPIALFQHTTKDMMFSGGGFVDFNNSAGLGENTLFVAFTSTGRGECLAYSHDGGITFTELPENPIIKHTGRDPKVFWYEPEQKWVLVVFSSDPCAETEKTPMLGNNKKQQNYNFTFYESTNLREWKRTGAFTDPHRAATFECPDIFPFEIDGETKWVLYGGQAQYFVGRFDGKTFHKETGPFGGPANFWTTQHGSFYAAQNFSQTPDGRVIRVGWLKIKEDYTKQYPRQTTRQALSLPHELQLKKTDNGLRLASIPIKELESLRAGELEKLEDCKGELTEVLIEFEEDGLHELMINGIDASFEGQSARIFTDRTFNEVYADGGLYYKARHRTPKQIDSTETSVKNGTIKSLKIYRLHSIWK